MEKFKLTDELGIVHQYYTVIDYEYNGEVYLIYTDLVPDEYGENRLFAGQNNNSNIIRVEQTLETKIISSFRSVENQIDNVVKEVLKNEI